MTPDIRLPDVVVRLPESMGQQALQASFQAGLAYGLLAGAVLVLVAWAFARQRQ